MESRRLAIAFAVFSVVLLGFSAMGAAAIREDAGELAPSPAMSNGAMALGAPVVATSVVSLLAWFI